MSSPHALLAELDRELPATRRVIERLPDDRLDWRPHPKSMSAGQLAQHIASIPGGVAGFARGDGLDVSTRPADYAACASVSAALASLDASAAAMRGLLSELDTERAQAPWRLSYRDRELFTMPRIEVVRTMGFNHWYHHRGELVVYLRLLGVPVPIVYGRSADDNPFG
jgi:uncharacterized damage-inducible protein DinB